MNYADVDAVDTVVLGSGLAGLSAANRALDHGLRVLVLDATPGGGGSTAISGGWFAFGGTPLQREQGINDSDELFFADMVSSAEGKADESLLWAFVENQEQTYALLVQLTGGPQLVSSSSDQSVPRSHLFPIGTIMEALRHEISHSPHAQLMMGARATGLRPSAHPEGSWEVDYSQGRRSGTIVAQRGVVLATGGFSRNSELIARFAPDEVNALAFGGRGNTGDGFLLAAAHGAGWRDVEYISSTFGTHPDTRWPEHELLMAYYLGAIIVNTNAERFVDESQSYKVLGPAVLRQPGYLAWEIFDVPIRTMGKPGVALYDMDALEAKGRFVVADSLEQLAKECGLEAPKLVTTVDEYNQAVRENRPSTPPRHGLVHGTGALREIAEPPYYAYLARPMMSSTYGGLTVDSDARVTTASGQVIPGLYAAGEVVSGFHGRDYMTGTALSKAAIFGRVAADTIAQSD